MPNLHLETTADLPENADVPDILTALGETMARVEGVSPASVKVFHSLRSVWVTGEGAPPGFAILTVAVLEGRSEEWRSSVSSQLLGVLTERFAYSLEEAEISISVEMRQMERSSYNRKS